MKKFVLLHYGFEKPTPQIMNAWGKWFEAMKNNIVDMGGHFSRGRGDYKHPCFENRDFSDS